MTRIASSRGTASVLSVGGGDITISFDPANPAERIRAARVVRDMLRRGYALLVEVDGKFTRALDFDEERCVYVIADFDPVTARALDEAEQQPQGGGHVQEQGKAQASDQGATHARSEPRPKVGSKRVVKRELAAEDTRAVAVARTAGG